MTDAVAFIDWISYTRANDEKLLEYPSIFAGLSRKVLFEWQKFNESENQTYEEETPCKPNRPFQYARQNRRTKSRIEWGGGSDRVLCTFSGEGCRHLRSTGKTQEVLSATCSDITRVDLSADLRTATTPFEFCGKRAKEKHKNGSLMYSDEGTTQYVGSWSSDRFARVYRYNPPHERQDFLRCEHVFKGKQAKILASKLVSNAPAAVIEAVGEIYGWAHDDWNMAKRLVASPENVVWYKEERHPSKTRKWLEETAVPSLIKLVRTGEIVDVNEWLWEHLYEKLKQEDT